MAKLSHGPASYAVTASAGPASAPLHFYSTNYSRHHGNHPTMAHGGVARRTRGTGYIANFRPTLYYSSPVDHLDNPAMISLLADNYSSLTAQHYSGFRSPTSAEPFPPGTHTGQSGYSRSHSVPMTRASAKQGPGVMSTETQTRFTHKPFRHEGVRGSQHTCREDTGFTHAQNIEPVTFRPPEAFANDLSPLTTWRPTGRSLMKKDFPLPSQLTGREGVPLLSERADRSNGYVKGSNFHSPVQPKSSEMVGYTVEAQLHPQPLASVCRQDPAHYSTITQPHHFSSYTHYSLEAGRRAGEGRGGGGGGRKELTGFSENNQPLVEPQDKDKGRFSTHYSAHFPRPQLHRTGRVASAPPAANGFSRGTRVHHLEEGPANTAHVLYCMHPSQARVVLRRDPCYDDHTHSAKHHTPNKRRVP